MAQIRQFMVSPLETNCYAYVCDDGTCMVVDPGDAGGRIAEQLADVDVRLIVCTHGHNDHCSGVAALRQATGASFAMPEDDLAWALEHAGKRDLSGRSYGDPLPQPDRLLHDGDSVQVGDATFRVLATPGHTPGSVVLLGEDVAFTGDTLFADSCGRCDLPGGDQAQMMASLRRLRRDVPPQTAILPGHGRTSTMERELVGNPWLQDENLL